uniref:Protein farnesyltransferase subunit beta n=1 Tax=Kwoniella bestiolae CBS 10118 TaxID=1296100 RepID=A0A1B9G7K9_9TREE|nr:protein farnesyltransferase subunit beta [Kwoniella bestiolae CBS 10118]OCF26970.1 protein farnesyltransferase subunit beta [Kwoniella bestiolae CBS 10118]
MSSLTPSIYTLPTSPLPTNSHPTSTLTEQQETESLISSLFALLPPPTSDTDSDSITSLRKQEHTQFLASTFFKLPGKFVSLDASRPWLVFWSVHSLDLLGVALDQGTKDRVVSTILKFLSPSGGFAGGPANSQLPHLLPTYASVCSLAITGNPGAGGGWEQLKDARQGIYNFFMDCKKDDGGFVVCKGGEVDVSRGTYCLLVVATLLDILTPELLRNVDKFISACQTYEGGFACSQFAFPYTSPSAGNGEEENLFVRASMSEAHGGYTSCSLNSHFLLSSIPLSPSFPQKIDANAALRWSVLQQGEAIEGGGFRGRTNKLVDGCYSWWVGGGIPVCEELIKRQKKQIMKGKKNKIEVVDEAEREEDWEDEILALQEFTLIAAQQEAGGSGGLRDKPGKRPDQYHTCNNLSGLSIAQHAMKHSSSVVASNKAKFDTTKGLPPVKTRSSDGGWKSEEERQKARREIWANALGWVEDESQELIVGGKGNRINTTTPVFNILGLRLKPFINYFYCQEE